jgi:hypothetical protein
MSSQPYPLAHHYEAELIDFKKKLCDLAFKTTIRP